MSDLIRFVQQEFDATWNKNDLEGVMDRFSEDAIVRSIPPLPGAPEQFTGKAQVRGFVQMLMVNFHVNSKDFRQDGNRVMWFATVTSDSIRAMGVPALDADCEATIINNKVALFVPRFTEESLAKLAAAARHAE